MQEEKKQLEIVLMDYFRECYKDFPKGKSMPGESPDFVIRMKNSHLLGVELTRLNPANAVELSEQGRADILFREGFIGLVKSMFEHQNTEVLFVKFLFSEEHKLEASREMVVAAMVCKLLRESVKNRSGNSFYQLTFTAKDLPQGLDRILIVHHPKLKTPIWERSNNLGISNNVVDDIKQAIHKKDEKLRLYQKQKLNYYWLLITSDRLRGAKSFNLNNKITNQEFDSRFQHVFLFDLIQSRVFTLR